MAARFGYEGRDDSEKAGSDEIEQKTNGDVSKIVERENMILKADPVAISEAKKNELLGGERRDMKPDPMKDIPKGTSDRPYKRHKMKRF